MRGESIFPEKQPVTGPNRPDFGPTQIRALEELQVGGMPVIAHHGASAERLEITSAPYQKTNGNWWIRVTSDYPGRLSTEKLITTESSLADHGVVAYTDGMWNLYNWLERVNIP